MAGGLGQRAACRGGHQYERRGGPPDQGLPPYRQAADVHHWGQCHPGGRVARRRHAARPSPRHPLVRVVRARARADSCGSPHLTDVVLQLLELAVMLLLQLSAAHTLLFLPLHHGLEQLDQCGVGVEGSSLGGPPRHRAACSGRPCARHLLRERARPRLALAGGVREAPPMCPAETGAASPGVGCSCSVCQVARLDVKAQGGP